MQITECLVLGDECKVGLLVVGLGGQDSFRHFLRSEYSEENMMFWLACEELKEIRDNSHITDKCKQIYEEFISVLSPKEVSQ